MGIVKIQISHTKNLNKEVLASHLYDEIGEEYDLSEDDVESYFEIENIYKLPNDSFISIFTIAFPELDLRDLEPKDIVKSYLDTLNHLDEVISLVKLQDDFLQEIANQFFNRLFAIEMELRNVLTYILTYDEKPIEKGVFKELKNPTLFNTVKPFHGSIQWIHEQDFCPDTLYEEGVPVQ